MIHATVGPYCELDETTLANNILNTCGPQEDYIRHLQKLQCSSSATPGRFTWKPDRNTPNIVYYQVNGSLNTWLSYIVFCVYFIAVCYTSESWLQDLSDASPWCSNASHRWSPKPCSIHHNFNGDGPHHFCTLNPATVICTFTNISNNNRNSVVSSKCSLFWTTD